MSVPPAPTSLPPDYHMHTALCKHATGMAPDYARQAVAKTLPEICFTDHGPTPDGYDAAYRMALAQFPSYLETVREAVEADNLPVFLGIEADFYEGCEPFLREWLPQQAFDVVLGSVHYIGDWGFDNPSERDVWESVDIRGAWAEYFALISRMVSTGMYDVAAHIDLPKKFGHRPSDADLKEMACPVLDQIAGAGMAIEINTAGLRKPVREMYPSALLLSWACERGIPLCIGSDAHNPKSVGYAFPEAVAMAREVGYTETVTFRGRTMVPRTL